MLNLNLISKIQTVFNNEKIGTFSIEEKRQIEEHLRHIIADELECELDEVAVDTYFDDLGIDSITFLQIFDCLKKSVGIDVPTGQLMVSLKGYQVDNIHHMTNFITGYLENYAMKVAI